MNSSRAYQRDTRSLVVSRSKAVGGTVAPGAAGSREISHTELGGTRRSRSLNRLGPSFSREHIATELGSLVVAFVPASPGPQTVFAPHHCLTYGCTSSASSVPQVTQVAVHQAPCACWESRRERDILIQLSHICQHGVCELSKVSPSPEVCKGCWARAPLPQLLGL